MDNAEKNIIFGAKPIVPLYENSLGKLILDNLKNHKNQICMIDASTGKSVNFDHVLHKTVTTAEVMKKIGLGKGDVISVSSENHLNFFIPVIAAMYLGITVAPLNQSYTIREFVHTLNISKPKLVFCNSKLVAKFLEIRKELSFIKQIVTIEPNETFNNTRIENIEEFMNGIPPKTAEEVNSYLVTEVDIVDNVALILCSSGTTGLPKGVMLTHLNLLTSLANHQDPRFPLFIESKGNKNLGMLPFFHGLGFVTALTSIVRGNSIVMLNRFEEKLFLQAIQDYKIISAMLVPPILNFLAKSSLVEQYDISSLRNVACGAAPLGKETLETVMKRLNLQEIRQGYGLTEATLAMTINTPGMVKVGSVGSLVPYMKCKVADSETGEGLGPNCAGELCFKGPMVMKGYCSNPKATRETFDEDGWLRTGDVGYYDTNGYFYIVDRIKELIKYKGYQVAPAELEHLLLSNPKIKDAAVVGVSDEEAGELPLAFVVRQPGTEVTITEVKQFVAKQVSPQKRLYGGVIFVDAIPKNASGKILRRQLKKLLENKFKSKL